MDEAKKKPWKTYLFWIALPETAGLIAGLLTRDGIKRYSTAILKPALSPPPWTFPVAWTALYALMGVGAARIYGASPSAARTRSIRLFLTQLFFNFCWCFLFFSLRGYAVAFFWLAALIALVIWMAITFRQVDRLAAGLQIPYILWLLFAAYLNLGVWLMN